MNTKEKQIEEWDNNCIEALEHCFILTNCNGCPFVGQKNCLEKAGRGVSNLIDRLKLKIDRKQSEGEWIEIDAIDDGWKQYSCNCCGWRENHDLHLYCPNCGAKMKGGEE